MRDKITENTKSNDFIKSVSCQVNKIWHHVCIGAIFGSGLVLAYSCGEKDPVPEPPTPPVEKNDTVFVSVASVLDAKNNLSVIKNADAKKTYQIDYKDFPADSAEMAGPLKDFGQALNGLSSKKVVNKNGSGTYPNAEQTIISFPDWKGGTELALKLNPKNGFEYLAATAQDSIDFKNNAGATLKVYRANTGEKPAEGDVVIKVSSREELISKLSEIKTALQTIGAYKVFVDMNGNIAVISNDNETLEEYNNEKILVGGEGRIVPGEYVVNTSAKALQPFNLGAASGTRSGGSDNRFHVSGDASSLNPAKNSGVVVESDSWNVSATNLNLNSYYVPDTLKINTDKTPNINSQGLQVFKNLRGTDKKIVLQVSGSKPLNLEYYNVDVASLMQTKATREFYNLSALGDPSDSQYNQNFGPNGPYEVKNTAGGWTNPVITSMHISNGDAITDGDYYNPTNTGNDKSNSAMQQLEASYDISGKATKFTTDGQTSIRINYTTSTMLAKYSPTGGTTQGLFAPSFLYKLSAMFDLVANKWTISLYTDEVFIGYPDSEADNFSVTGVGKSPNTVKKYLADKYNLVVVEEGQNSFLGSAPLSFFAANKFVRTATGYQRIQNVK